MGQHPPRPEPRTARHATTVSLPDGPVPQARELEAGLPAAAAAEVTRADTEAADGRYAAEHRDKMDAWSAYFEQHGLPLADHRLF